MAVPTPQTIFTRDILGNYVCNTLVEAQASGPFDLHQDELRDDDHL
jgi:hypothetical protein